MENRTLWRVLFVMLTKVCTKCNEKLPVNSNYFKSHKRGKYGFYSICKRCESDYRKNSSERIKGYNQTYYQDNIDKAKSRYELTKDTKPHIRYYAINKDHIRKRYTVYRQKRKDYLNEQARRNYAMNKYRFLQYKKKYVQSVIGREVSRKICQNRRAVRRNLESNFTVDNWISCKCYFENKCAYCGKEKMLAQDHFVPLSKNGEYTVNNIVPSCRSCNSSKSNKDFFEWYPMFRYYSKSREEKILKYLNYDNNIQQLTLII